MLTSSCVTCVVQRQPLIKEGHRPEGEKGLDGVTWKGSSSRVHEYLLSSEGSGGRGVPRSVGGTCYVQSRERVYWQLCALGAGGGGAAEGGRGLA